jgi:hypothetical protein
VKVGVYLCGSGAELPLDVVLLTPGLEFVL